MVSVWFFVANFLLPVPLVLFILLTIPSPRNVRRGVLLFCSNVFDLKLVGAFKLLHVALFLTSVAFLSAIRQLQLVQNQQQYGTFGSPNQEIALLSKKWRTERNIWIAAFAVSAWVGVAAFYRESLRRVAAETELYDLKMDQGDSSARAPATKRQTGVTAAAGDASDLPLPKVVTTLEGDLGTEEPDAATEAKLMGDLQTNPLPDSPAGPEVELVSKPVFDKKDD